MCLFQLLALNLFLRSFFLIFLICPVFKKIYFMPRVLVNEFIILG
jgi:hypothetical protein